MHFASVRVVTSQFDELVGFYATLTGVEPTPRAPGFSEIRLEGCALAISSEAIINAVNAGAIVPNANRSMMIELQVDDVDALCTHAETLGIEIIQRPTTMPWGNRSMLLRDPDGAVINIFSRPPA